MSWFSITNINELDSPALVVFPERVKHNIQQAISMVQDVGRLRPHVKTNKSPEAVALCMEAGINKFKCATIAEAEMLAICGARDILLSYQPGGPKIFRFIELIKKYHGSSFSCLVDNPASAEEMSSAFEDAGLRVPVYIDINVGMNRTGIGPEYAPDLFRKCSQLDGIYPVGLHAYDGHIRQQDFSERTQVCNVAFSRIKKTQETLMTSGFPEPLIIAGGSPTFSIHSKREKVECSPGTFIYWDKGYEQLCSEQPFLTSVIVISRVISKPGRNKICTDLGHKSIAPENDINRRVHFINAPLLKPISQSEEHMVLEVAEGESYNVGDVLYGIPYHICPTVSQYERMYTVEDGNVIGEWKVTARDRKITV